MKRPNLKDLKCEHCGDKYSPQCNHTKYCGAACARRAEYAAHMLDPKWRMRKLVAMAKNRAAKKLLDFDIDGDYMMTLWTGECAVTGVQLDLHNCGYRRVSPYAPSIDRIEPELGYTIGNVRIVCYQANVAISEFGLRQFHKFVEQACKFKGVN